MTGTTIPAKYVGPTTSWGLPHGVECNLIHRWSGQGGQKLARIEWRDRTWVVPAAHVDTR
jgi:hypothetical protein